MCTIIIITHVLVLLSVLDWLIPALSLVNRSDCPMYTYMPHVSIMHKSGTIVSLSCMYVVYKTDLHKIVYLIGFEYWRWLTVETSEGHWTWPHMHVCMQIYQSFFCYSWLSKLRFATRYAGSVYCVVNTMESMLKIDTTWTTYVYVAAQTLAYNVIMLAC